MKYASNNNVKVVFDIDYRPDSWQNKKETSIFITIL